MIEVFETAPELGDATNKDVMEKFYDDEEQLGGSSLSNMNSMVTSRIEVPIDKWVYS